MSERLPRRIAVILAAGKGTRMRSELAKVLHPFLGRPMIHWLVGAALDGGADRVVVVVGHQAEAVKAAVSAAFSRDRVGFALQDEQRGTGHAVMCAFEQTEGFDEVMILSGDTPALDAETIGALVASKVASGAVVTLATMIVDDPPHYGRIVRDDRGAVVKIVEHADATDAEREIRELNAGLYLADRAPLGTALAGLSADNAQGEVYLTDIAESLSAGGAFVSAHVLADPDRVAGINTRAQLARLEAIVLRERLERLMEAGVSIHNPASVRLEATVEVGVDTVIGAGVQLFGKTTIGRGVRIDAGCVLTDCEVGDAVHLKPYVVADSVKIEARASCGPFAHLRPGTELGEGAKIGNFVETKKARIGRGSKASHLSYLGDCEIGTDVNVGAGTITCNYDGFDKHKTVLEDGVFIGSDTQLVAPVRIGKNVTVAAGTTVTADVPEGALVLSRTQQKVIEGYYERRRRPREEAKRRDKEDI